MVLIVGILLANFITMKIDAYMFSYKKNYPPYLFTWIGMAVIVLIYYPLFTKIDKWATMAGDKFMRAGKKIIGKEIGALITFLLALFLLYYLYGNQWFGTNVVKSFFKAI